MTGLRASIADLVLEKRFAVWLMMIILLCGVLLFSWHKLMAQTESTALSVASKRILERANYYQQQWLLAGQPEQLQVNQKFIQFSAKGWALPLNQASKVDCNYWWKLFYEEQRVLGSLPDKINDNSKASNYQCDYSFSAKDRLEVSLIDDKFVVNVIFTAE
ncbi:hypothetical protein BIY21_15620 [Vibrio ponticus]|uniref:MSHA biogenesis protein MshF n=1 Tax=Vibrio ponticus TaxID=265668 RepID=A0ABX3FE56_9VIBR|nr:hypothetical protein [Vibrio ponticus]OLQ88885.1 hypothetical protein BIY21_15620 [Vibrio ponticus]